MTRISIRDGIRPGSTYTSPDVVAVYRGDAEVGTFCGFWACRGCDLPAAYVIDIDGGRLFLRGSVAAVGIAMQRRDQHTGGDTVDLSGLLTGDEIAALCSMWWH